MNKKTAIEKLKTLIDECRVSVARFEDALNKSKVRRDEGHYEKFLKTAQDDLVFFTYLLEQLENRGEKQEAKPTTPVFKNRPPVVSE